MTDTIRAFVQETTIILYNEIFGCLGYATNIMPYKSKFEARAHKCVFIGYPPGQTAFRLYNLDTKQVMVSRDVIFYENIFPFQLTSKQGIRNDIVPLPTIDNPIQSSENDITENESEDDSETNENLEDRSYNPEERNEPTQRQSTRTRKTPAWLNDYVVNTSITDASTSDITPTKPDYTPNTYLYITANYFNSSYTNFLVNVSTVSEPYSYEQAKENKE